MFFVVQMLCYVYSFLGLVGFQDSMFVFDDLLGNAVFRIIIRILDLQSLWFSDLLKLCLILQMFIRCINVSFFVLFLVFRIMFYNCVVLFLSICCYLLKWDIQFFFILFVS